MRILITGSGGFIGTALRSFLQVQKNPPQIFCISGRSSKINSPNTFSCQIEDRRKLRKTISRIRPDYIFHLAGGRGASDREIFESNFLGTQALLAAVGTLKLKPRIVLPGTAAEYGDIKGGVVNEKAKTRPISWYGLVKNMQVTLGLVHAQQGVDVVVARVFNIMGHGTPQALAVGRFARDLAALEKRKGRRVLATGSLADRRDFLDIEDVCAGLWMIACKGKRGEVYNLSSGKTQTMREVLRQLIRCSRAMDIVVKEKKHPPQPSCNSAGSNLKLRKLGWQPRVSFKESLRKTLEFYRGK